MTIQPPPVASEARALTALGARVRELRHEASLTLAELAERTGLSSRYLVSLEGGDGNISLLRLFELSEALGVSAATLVAHAEEARAADPEKHKVALVGLRGAGKTTVGRALAAATGATFVELDGLIAERAGMSLSMIFEMHGEAHFRKLEHEALVHLLEESAPMVVATGGSLVTAEATFALLRRGTHTVWLKARAEEHWDRVVAQGDGRPMKGRANAMNELRSLLKSRAPLYGRAELTLDTSSADIAHLVGTLDARFGDALRDQPSKARRAPAPRSTTRRNTSAPKRAR